ncbi:MAG TPA: hypothetical protein VMW56_22820 [Candidatus Margulisiibacteriota bacterium]|nr:hypothetical protein [Candidatus Margulisiibacteriota bacterium]
MEKFDVTPSDASTMANIIHPQRSAIEADLEICNHTCDQLKIRVHELEADKARLESEIARKEQEILRLEALHSLQQQVNHE